MRGIIPKELYHLMRKKKNGIFELKRGMQNFKISEPFLHHSTQSGSDRNHPSIAAII